MKVGAVKKKTDRRRAIIVASRIAAVVLIAGLTSALIIAKKFTPGGVDICNAYIDEVPAVDFDTDLRAHTASSQDIVIARIVKETDTKRDLFPETTYAANVEINFRGDLSGRFDVIQNGVEGCNPQNESLFSAGDAYLMFLSRVDREVTTGYVLWAGTAISSEQLAQIRRDPESSSIADVVEQIRQTPYSPVGGG
ncbi:hypothetical protein [Gordonia shandongensis]|uniref:hypothetical protein n=1 Tax=Gordonia shandongensis TaxID=376351 RepID=UPI0012EC793F|nr:hypothetical protein [Gordonia shandongensis]